MISGIRFPCCTLRRRQIAERQRWQAFIDRKLDWSKSQASYRCLVLIAKGSKSSTSVMVNRTADSQGNPANSSRKLRWNYLLTLGLHSPEARIKNKLHTSYVAGPSVHLKKQCITAKRDCWFSKCFLIEVLQLNLKNMPYVNKKRPPQIWVAWFVFRLRSSGKAWPIHGHSSRSGCFTPST